MVLGLFVFLFFPLFYFSSVPAFRMWNIIKKKKKTTILDDFMNNYSP